VRLDVLADARNVVLVAAQSLGKAMIAQNIAHAAVLAGAHVLFTTAAQLLLDLGGQESTRGLLVVDEIGSLSHDARAPPISCSGSSVAGMTFKVLTHNAYGFLDDAGLYGTGFLGLHCEARYGSFGEGVAIANPPYDIVGLQEYWNNKPGITCPPDHLMEAITSEGHYTGPDDAKLFQPVPGLFEIAGLGVFTLHTITESEGTAFDEQGTSGGGTLQGFLFARIENPGTQIKVDTYVVHTYAPNAGGCDVACHRAELQQLAARISQLSGSSGNPVLVIGDSNVSGPPGGAEPLDCYD